MHFDQPFASKLSFPSESSIHPANIAELVKSVACKPKPVLVVVVCVAYTFTSNDDTQLSGLLSSSMSFHWVPLLFLYLHCHLDLWLLLQQYCSICLSLLPYLLPEAVGAGMHYVMGIGQLKGLEDNGTSGNRVNTTWSRSENGAN